MSPYTLNSKPKATGYNNLGRQSTFCADYTMLNLLEVLTAYNLCLLVYAATRDYTQLYVGSLFNLMW